MHVQYLFREGISWKGEGGAGTGRGSRGNLRQEAGQHPGITGQVLLLRCFTLRAPRVAKSTSECFRREEQDWVSPQSAEPGRSLPPPL